MKATMDAASLHPPSYGGADLADAPTPSWVLLDFRAYFTDRRNATTTTCMTRDNQEIQITFFPAHPPRVSYFCVHCRGVEPGDFATEPKADGGPDGAPSLELLPHPSRYFFYDEQVGLLSREAEYTVVALRDDASAYFRGSSMPGKYDVCLLDSERKVWTTKAVFVPPERQQGSSGEEGFRHETTNVLTIGGEPGTMAFVDLWRGILLLDVLHGDPMLRYIRMPPPLSPLGGL
ncbi:hypothetical protein BAE44_0006395 [Dichanthelium oligosanthes]|uniref:Uncharacterized protein n=1 Tax=Dichanthelium oligosanthes TaxID=888268 RepID=A0A1E5W590_9POAL|nr:hypothetical protein BAE44_0006395 [Dichanthelium oligosanthes]